MRTRRGLLVFRNFRRKPNVSFSCLRLVDRHWGAGFLPSKYQGIRIGGSGDEPVKYLSNPKGMNAALRGRTIADIAALNRLYHGSIGDPEIETRIAQFEMAARMQISVPELADLKNESDHTIALYGDDSKTPSTYAYITHSWRDG